MNAAHPPPSIPSETPSAPRPGAPRTLRAREPAELLAQVHLQLRAAPRDSIALIGHAGRRRTVVTVRIDLAQAMGESGGGAIHDLLSALVGAGADGAFGVVVIGDGREQVCRDPGCPAHPVGAVGVLADDRDGRSGAGRGADGPCIGGPVDPIPFPCEAELEGVLAAMRLLAIAGTALPAFDLGELWVLAGSRATAVGVRGGPGPSTGPRSTAPRSTRPRGMGPRTTGPDVLGRSAGHEGGVDLTVSPPVPLAPVDSTLVAAEAVLAGESAPGSDGPGSGPLRAVLMLYPPEVARGRPRPPIEDTWREVAAELTRYRACPSVPRPELCMTACERLCVLAQDVRDPEQRGRLTALFLGRGAAAGTIDPDAPDRLVHDPGAAPHSSIVPGGSWYEALGLAVSGLRPNRGPGAGASRDAHAEGWGDLAALLALLAWWSHRFATAGALADEVLGHRPDHSLARWVALMAGAGIPPAWDPGASR